MACETTQPGKEMPAEPEKLEKPAPVCPAKLILFCINLFIGLIGSQLVPEWMDTSTYSTWKHVIKAITCAACRTS